MANGGAIAVGLADGILKGLEIRRRWERDDEDRKAREEDREYTRKQRSQADALQIALQQAAKPAAVSQPQDVMNDDEGNAMPAAPRFEVGGQRFGTQQEAEAAAAKHNDPQAMYGRVSQALLAGGKVGESLQFQQQAEKYGQERYRRRLGEAMGAGFGGIETFINSNESGPFKGKQVKFVPSEDGKTVVLNTVGPDGKLTPTQLQFPNDEKGPTIAGYMLDQAVTPEARYKLMVEEDRKKAEEERKQRDLERKEGESAARVALAETRADTARTQADVALLRAEIAQRKGSGGSDTATSREERLRWTSLHSESGRRLSEAQKALSTLQADPAFMVRAKKPGSPEAAQLANMQEDAKQYKEDRDMYARLLGGSQAEEARAARSGGAAPAPAAAPAGGGKPAAKAPAGKVAAPKSKADYDALPKGARYQHPDDPPGTYRTKK